MHLSMRVPWRDRAWDGAVCNAPTGNPSCVLLANIGPKRDDEWEDANAGADIDSIDQGRLPCLSERATFMSPKGYALTKTHPYSMHRSLKGTLHPTSVVVPGYAFEAVPFRWLSRESIGQGLGDDQIQGYRHELEDLADGALGFSPGWVMDGRNQRAAIDAFFEPISPDDSLVFIYMKHSPLQEERGDRLLVGAARVARLRKPPMWTQSGAPPFESSMWETLVEHTLRPEMADGVLLPYQELVRLMDSGVDVSPALAWAPDGRDIEFSYVTEHVSDDAAIQALASIEGAARALPELGLALPEAAIEWIERETARLWRMRGPVPGLGAVLGHLGVEHAYRAARGLVEAAGEGADPWPLLEKGFADPSSLPDQVRQLVGGATARVWSKRSNDEKSALRLLSGLDISQDQVAMLVRGESDVQLELTDLPTNPYWASTCTYGQPEHVPFSTVDRACFPDDAATWDPIVATTAGITDHQDRRRVEALLTDVLESAGHRGDTVLPQDEAIALTSEYALARPPQVTEWLLDGLDLDGKGLARRWEEGEEWSPLVGVELAESVPGLKLTRFRDVSALIRSRIDELRERPRQAPLAKDARALIDAALPALPDNDPLEEQARTEKAAGLSEMFRSPLTVLIGPAGTGKTTLLKALVDELPDERVLLVAPTGKARVQLQTKVQREAHTLASFLARSDRFDGDRYLTLEGGRRERFGLVVIDEASMLTEEMLAATLDALEDVKRLVLVGDPRQLPPIGAGRPFVDLVNELRPDAFASAVRVAEGYVELRVPRRQTSAGEDAGRRADLALATWFGDGQLTVEAENIWGALAATPDLGTVRYVPWDGRLVGDVLSEVLSEELQLGASDDALQAFALSYGGTLNGKYLNFDPGAGVRAEEWQILSPTRSRVFGTTELNRFVKRTFRQADLAFARAHRSWNIPAPLGPEQIVLGDKVMATQNGRRKSWPERSGLDYVANGEIGVAIGRVVNAAKRAKRSLRLAVEYSSQPGAQYSYWPSGGEDAPLELAWAVTVHKSQGSEFRRTFLILPAQVHVSRELMYTALTRQTDRVVILHDGALDGLRALSEPWRSETARRLTDLFSPPKVVSLEIDGSPQRYDGRVIHVAPNNVVVKSKNEVIVAMLLEELAPRRWTYEKPLRGADGREIHPDFAIERPGRPVLYWEHLGMLDDPRYARTWALKKAWYQEQGIGVYPNEGANGTLLTTSDTAGVDLPAWRALAAEALGVLAAPVFKPGPRRAGPGRRRPEGA